MSNLDILIEHGTHMVKCTNNGGTTVVGLIGANLTNKEIKVGIRKITKKSKRIVANVTVNSNAIVFELA